MDKIKIINGLKVFYKFKQNSKENENNENNKIQLKTKQINGFKVVYEKTLKKENKPPFFTDQIKLYMHSQHL